MPTIKLIPDTGHSIAARPKIQDPGEGRLNLTGPPGLSFPAMSNTLVYSIAFIALGLTSSALGPTLPALAKHTNASLKEISILFVARSTGTMLGSWAIGRLYDRFAGHPMLAASLAASAAALLLVPETEMLAQLGLIFAWIGLAGGSLNVGGNALIVMIHGEKVRPHMSTMHFAFGLGGLLAPILVALFDRTGRSFELTYRALAAISVFSALLLALTASPARRPRDEGDESDRAPAMVLLLLVVFFFLEVGAEGSLMGWIFSYAAETGADTRTAAYVNSAFWAAFTLGRLATIGLAVRFDALRLVQVNLGLWIAVVALLIALPSSLTLLWFGAIATGLAMAPVFPNTFGFANRRLRMTGRVTGLFLVGSSAGGIFWPWLIGQFFKSHGPVVLPAVVLFCLLSAAISILLLSRRHPERG